MASDYARSLAFYRDVLGAKLVSQISDVLCLLRFGGSELNIRVPDCVAAYEVLRSRGAQFLTPPVDWGYEVRAFLRDPDGHLIELTQSGQ